MRRLANWSEIERAIDALQREEENLRRLVGGVAYQPADADLTAISALAGTGVACRTAADTWALRTMAAPAAGLTIANPGGVAGNPTFALANDLAGLEGLAATGIACRTAADTWAQRTITSGCNLTITNPGGVAGNIDVGLNTDAVRLGSIGLGRAPTYQVDAYSTVGDAIVAATTTVAGASGSVRSYADGGRVQMDMLGTGIVGNIFGATPYADLALIQSTSASNFVINTVGAIPLIFATNTTAALTISALGAITIANTLTVGAINGPLSATAGLVAALTTSSANGVTCAWAANNLQIDTPQDVRNTASPTFAGMTLTAFAGVVKAAAGVLSASALIDADVAAGAAIAWSKLANINTSRMLGRGTAGAGAVEEMVLSSTYGMSFTYAAASLVVDTPQDLRTSGTPQFARLGLGVAADANTELKVIPTSVSNEGRCYWQGNGAVGMRMGFNDNAGGDRSHWITLNAATFNPGTGAVSQDSASYASWMQNFIGNNTDATSTVTWQKCSAGAVAWTIVLTLTGAGNLTATGAIQGTEARASSDVGGLASTTSMTNATTAVSTGVGTVLMGGATSRNSNIWLKFYVGTTAYYVPAWSTITG